MEGKDDRHKSKRSKMRHYKKTSFHPQQQQCSKTDSNSPNQTDVARGVIDVADSSDERFSPRTIHWTRPRSPIESDMENYDEMEDNEQMRAGDFELLRKMPTSVGGHFQFSSEKNWDSEDILEKSEASEYFTLNLNLLNAGVQTIPLYKRIDASLSFDKSEIKSMNDQAEAAEKVYIKILQDLNKPKSASRKGTAKSVKSASIQKENVVPPVVQTKENDELDELLNMTTSGVSHIQVNDKDKSTISVESPDRDAAKSDAGNKENATGIQDWLDNVLDE